MKIISANVKLKFRYPLELTLRCFLFYTLKLNLRGTDMTPVPDLPIGYIGLSLRPQDPRGPPTDCGTHRVKWPVCDHLH